jgi:hypothetical protein
MSAGCASPKRPVRSFGSRGRQSYYYSRAEKLNFAARRSEMEEASKDSFEIED